MYPAFKSAPLSPTYYIQGLKLVTTAVIVSKNVITPKKKLKSDIKQKK